MLIKKLNFPSPFKHKHPPVQDVNKIFDEQRTFGQKTADAVASTMGSWKFIIIQTIVFIVWVILNITAYIYHWDPYPFILMNLALSMQAAYAAPIIMMSQNRQVERDRLDAKNDYIINQKTEEEVRVILDHLTAQDEALKQIHEILTGLYPQLLEKENNS